MWIDHVHFYVEQATVWRDWFVERAGFAPIARSLDDQTHTEIVQSGAVQIRLSAPLTTQSPVAHYLAAHPPGVADVAFRVQDLAAVLRRAVAAGADRLLPPLPSGQTAHSTVRIPGWADLSHTLIQTASPAPPFSWQSPRLPPLRIDHVVLNVEKGDLQAALDFYQTLFGWQRQQQFSIRTDRSALQSQVLVHPAGEVQFPINEPASPNSQIQEFLDCNGGAGIQHIALRTPHILETIAQLRQRGLACLSVPTTYYDQLRQRPGFPLSAIECQQLAALEILVDWPVDRPQAMLLQTFTHPIFGQPTFFFELIERRLYQDPVNHGYRQAEGFGEGNFQALFEAIEREQMKRGSLS